MEKRRGGGRRVAEPQPSADASTSSGRCSARVAASAACLIASAVLAEPVRIDVVAVRMDEGHAVLTLSREHSKAWYSKFAEVTFGDDFHRRVPDGWQHKGKRSVSVTAFDLYDGVLRIRHVPSDEASFRQLMVAVRHAIGRTNAAEPSEDPPIADSSLTPVLEDVFRTGQRGVASGTP